MKEKTNSLKPVFNVWRKLHFNKHGSWTTHGFSLGEDGKMFCQYCVDTKKANAFTTGCGDFLKDYVKKHNSSVDHRHALQERTLKKNMETSILTAHRKDKAAIMSAMRTAYYLGKKNRPNSDFEDLLHFQRTQVLNFILFQNTM